VYSIRKRIQGYTHPSFCDQKCKLNLIRGLANRICKINITREGAVKDLDVLHDRLKKNGYSEQQIRHNIGKAVAKVYNAKETETAANSDDSTRIPFVLPY
jgi:hypothetical protein